MRTTSLKIPQRSRLVDLLTELSQVNLSSSEHNLAERLGHLIGMSGSISLARGLRQPLDEVDTQTSCSAKELQNQVLAARERMIHVITRSFSSEATDQPIRVPSSNGGFRPEALQTYDPYKRFYTTHQVEMAAGIGELRDKLRDGMSGISTELQHLAELDKMLDESLAVSTRKLFNLPTKLLEQRFKLLLQAHRQEQADAASNEPDDWLNPGGWLDLFYRDMRELLLAEFDVRLQPVLGLLEALNEHVDTTS